MSTLKYAVLGAAALAALAFASSTAEASNKTTTWCKSRGAADAHIISDGSSTLTWKPTGELVLESTNHLIGKIWSSGTAGTGDKVCWESNGTLAVYNTGGTKLWSQSGGGFSVSSSYDYVVEPVLSSCDLSSRVSIYFGSSSALKGTLSNQFTLWTKSGECAEVSPSAVGGPWCADNTEEVTVLRSDWSQLVWKTAGFLTLQGTGSAGGTAIWSTSTAGQGKKLCFETDGELAIYNSADQAIWSTGSSSLTSGYLLGLDDCNLEIKRLDGDTSPWTSTHTCPQSVLAINKTVYVASSDTVLVQNDDAELVFASTGNVILRSLAGDVYWTSALPANRGKKVSFQTDGNLVIYNSSNVAVFTTGTAGLGIDTLQLDRCSFSLLDGSTSEFARGSSSCKQSATSNAWSLSAVGDAILLRTTEAYLSWQSDGNLVVYTTSGTSLWTSGTANSGKTLKFQSDGNLVIYNSSNAPVWDSNTNASGSPAYTLQLNDSCTLRIASTSAVKWTGLDSCAVVNYSYEKSDGNSTFGVSLRTEMTAEDTGTARADSTTSLEVTIFGTTKELFSATVSQTEADHSLDLGDVSIAVFGESVAASASYSQELEIIKYEQTFTVGIVPVTVSAGATGELGLSLTYSLGTLTLTPSAKLSATVSAGIGAENDAAGASAGIRGTLTLIEVSLPITMKIANSTYVLTGSLELDSLSGSLELYAEAYVKLWGVKIGVDWSKTIFSWDGVSWNKTLFSESGNF